MDVMTQPPTPAVPTPKQPKPARITPAPRSPVNGHNVGTPEQTPERQLIVLRQQYLALDAELTHTKGELAHLRAELAGTQAGERTARFQAMHDGLTGQANRRLFMDELRKAMCQARHGGLHTSVMYLDVDQFKLINDEHGHKVGDGVLKTVGARLAKSVRTGDMVARLGGDEFACLLQGDVSNPQLLALAHKLYESIAAPMKLGSLTLHVNISIGLACAPGDAQTAEALLDRADVAMYHAKQHRLHVVCASAPELARQSSA